MDHEGTPITFKIERVRRDQDDYDKRLDDRRPNLGVFVTPVKIKGEFEKAKVWSPRSASVHTVPIDTVCDFHGKAINIESMVVHTWEALAMTLPNDLVIDEKFVVSRIENVELRSKIAILATKAPMEWPVTNHYDKDGDLTTRDLDEVTKDWPLNRCMINMHDSCEVRFGNVVLEISDDPHIKVQAITLKRGRKKAAEQERWAAFDPENGEHSWKKEAGETIGKMMRAYEAMKALGSVK